MVFLNLDELMRCNVLYCTKLYLLGPLLGFYPTCMILTSEFGYGLKDSALLIPQAYLH